MRIPITMCHGVSHSKQHPLTVEHLDTLMRIAADMGFCSISYDDLAGWREGADMLPKRPIMIDFDHPVKSMRYGVKKVLDNYGFKGNLFVQTQPLSELHSGPIPPLEKRDTMTWDELAELVEAGWNIGGHTVTHPNLSQLSLADPSGEVLARELDESNAALRQHLGITPKDFAFTGTSWSTVAEREVSKRYRFGRLWIVGPTYQVDGKEVRYADFVGVEGEDEADGGPPMAARYITRDTPPYRLPSVEIQRDLIYRAEAFRAYLEGALEDQAHSDSPRRRDQ